MLKLSTLGREDNPAKAAIGWAEKPRVAGVMSTAVSIQVKTRWVAGQGHEALNERNPLIRRALAQEKCSAHEGPVNLNVSQEGTRVAA